MLPPCVCFYREDTCRACRNMYVTVVTPKIHSCSTRVETPPLRRRRVPTRGISSPAHRAHRDRASCALQHGQFRRNESKPVSGSTGEFVRPKSLSCLRCAQASHPSKPSPRSVAKNTSAASFECTPRRLATTKTLARSPTRPRMLPRFLAMRGILRAIRDRTRRHPRGVARGSIPVVDAVPFQQCAQRHELRLHARAIGTRFVCHRGERGLRRSQTRPFPVRRYLPPTSAREHVVAR
jgi:hypothetical protein